ACSRRDSLSFFFSILRPPPSSTLFPYTTLFRSMTPEAEVKIPGPDTFSLADYIEGKSTFPSFTHTVYLDQESGTKLVQLADEYRSEEHTSELQSRENLVCRLLLEKKNNNKNHTS